MSIKDPFGFENAINWDVVFERTDEIAAIFPDANPRDYLDDIDADLGRDATDPYETGDDEPCCLLYREHYPQDHEYGCYRRKKSEMKTETETYFLVDLNGLPWFYIEDKDWWRSGEEVVENNRWLFLTDTQTPYAEFHGFEPGLRMITERFGVKSV